MGKDPARIWFNTQEDNVIKHIQKVDKDNRFYDFRKLPFVWAPCGLNSEIRNDETMGIPSSEEEYAELRLEGRYIDTEIEDIYFVKSQNDTTGAVSYTIMDESDPNASKIDLKKKFSKFFLGVPYHLAPHKNDVDKTFPKMWTLVDEVRRALRHAVVKIESFIPHMLVPMFRAGRYRNWEDIKSMTLDFLDLKKDNVDLKKFPSFLRAVSDPKMRVFRIESKIITLREFFIQFFGSLEVDNKKYDLGEVTHDRLVVRNSAKPKYDPFLNWLCISLVLMGEESSTVKKWFQDLATKLNKEEEDILMNDILENKSFLYEKINKKNAAELTFDNSLFEYAHKNHPDDMSKGAFQLTNYRKEGAKDWMANNNDKNDKKENTFLLGSEESSIEEDLYYHEDHEAYFVRVDRKRGTRARNFNNFNGARKRSFKRGAPARQNQDFRKSNRDNNRIRYKEASKNKQTHNKQWGDRNNFLNRGRKFLSENRKMNERFRSRFQEAKNPGIDKSGPNSKPMVSKRRFERIRALTEDAISNLDANVEFVNQFMDSVELGENEVSSEEGAYKAAEISSTDAESESDGIRGSANSGILYGFLNIIWLTSILLLGGLMKPFKKILKAYINILIKIEKASTFGCSGTFFEEENFYTLSHISNDIFMTNCLSTENNKYEKILLRGVSLALESGKTKQKCRAIIDTGATSSLIPLELIEFMEENKKKVVKTWNGTQSARVAGGGVIGLENYRVSFDLYSKGHKITVQDALVSRTGPQDLLLIGIKDLVRNDLDFKSKNGKIVRFNVMNIPIEEYDSREFYGLCELLENKALEDPKREENLPDNSHVSFSICGNKYRKELKKPEEETEVIIDEKIKTKLMTWNYPLGEKSWLRHIDKIREAQYGKNTRNEVTIDPLNEVIPNMKNGEAFKSKINAILDKHHLLFRGDAGHVQDLSYTINTEIKQELMSKSCPNYYSSMDTNTLKAVIEKFDEEIASGILVKLPDDMEADNILPVFPVDKKSDDPVGSKNNDKVAVNFSKVRLVTDCSRNVNAATSFRPTQADCIKRNIQKVADYTKNGLIATLDITQMFFSFPLARNLWSKFCIEHPTMGLFCYTRLPMGWISSPAHSRLSMMRMLHKFKNNLTRYLDDICIFANTPEEFLEVLDKLLKTLWFYNLRLKGKKMSILGTTLSLIGKLIKKGVIFPNVHVVKNLDAKIWESIVTKRQLKGFLGVVTYIADHLPFKAELTATLDKAATGVLADYVKWTDSLRSDFEKVKEACKKLMALHPVDPNKNLYLVVDSSYTATGGFMFQYEGEEGEIGKKRFIRLFSRKRTSGENKLAISSCLTELNGIATVLDACQLEIGLCTKKVIVYTDNKPVYFLWKKLQNALIPSNDRRINNLFANLMRFNYEIVFLNNKTKPINFADYLSRETEFSKPCEGCRICNEAQLNSDPFRVSKKDGKNEEGYIEIVRLMIEEELCSFEPVLEPKLSFDEFIFGILNPTKVSWNDPYECFNKVQDNDNLKQEIELRYMTRNRAKNFNKDLSLKEMLDDKPKLIQWQESDSVIREAKLFFENGGVATKKGKKSLVRNLLETNKAYVSEGLLKIKRMDNVREIEVIVLPESLAPQVVTAVHNTFQHSSFHRFKSEIKRYFYIKNVDSHIRSMVNQCQGCILYGRKPKIIAPMRSFDDEIPNTIGQTVLVDEITRTKLMNYLPRLRSEGVTSTWKFLVATEYLSRYSLILPIKHNLTSEVLKSLLIEVKFFLGQSTAGDSEMVMSMDGCSVHTALLNDETLKSMKIKIKIRPRESTSKNHLAVIDGRISKMSKILHQHMSVKECTQSSVAKLTTRDYNNLPNAEFGVRPADLFFNRDVVTQNPLKITLKDLIDRRKKINAQSRASCEKRNKLTQYREPMNIIPWKKGLKYNDERNMPIKLGDKIILCEPFDKNKEAPIYEVVSNEEFPTGVDFEEKKVLTKKVGKNLRKFYIWRFDCISTIIEGKKSPREILNSLECFNWLNGTGELIEIKKAQESSSEDEVSGEIHNIKLNQEFSSSEDEPSYSETNPNRKLRYSDFEITSEDE